MAELRSSGYGGTRLATIAGLALGALALAAPAWATPLPPGATAFKTHPSVPDLPKYTIGLPGYFNAGNIQGTLMSNIVEEQPNGLNGTVTSTVYRNPATGFLTFAYFFTSDSGNPSPIVRATLDGFAGFIVSDAGADASGMSGAQDPNEEWTDGDPLFLNRDQFTEGLAIQWRVGTIGSALGAGDESSIIWFETNATMFRQSTVAVIDTALTGEGDILAPSTIIPLPSAALMGLAGLGVVAIRRRRA